MSVQFFLIWDELPTSSNALGIIALYRRKSVGGSFISAGFTPSNTMAKTVVSATSPVLLDNVIYEFIVQTTCTDNGPTNNSNGIQESINFTCILPVIVHTSTQVTATIDVTNTDITKAKFTLKKVSDNSIVSPATVITRMGNSIVATAIGLTAATAYYWQINLYSIINGIETIGATCSPYNITTSA